MMKMHIRRLINFSAHFHDIFTLTVKTMALEITKSLIMAPEALGTSAGNSIQPLKTKIRARSLDVRAH